MTLILQLNGLILDSKLIQRKPVHLQLMPGREILHNILNMTSCEQQIVSTCVATILRCKLSTMLHVFTTCSCNLSRNIFPCCKLPQHVATSRSYFYSSFATLPCLQHLVCYTNVARAGSNTCNITPELATQRC